MSTRKTEPVRAAQSHEFPHCMAARHKPFALEGPDAAFWKKAGVVIPMAKQTITIRLDADLLDWLRKQKGYQTRINAVLRTYMEASRG